MKVRQLATAAFAAAATAVAAGHMHPAQLQNIAVDQLKAIYLACDRAALRGELSSAAIMQCSVVYEELKWREFDGDFEKLIAWSRAKSQPGRR